MIKYLKRRINAHDTSVLVAPVKVNDFTSSRNIADKKWSARQREAKHPESAEHLWKADAFTKASIDAMEMQILRQILLRMGARARKKGRERERERAGKCKKLSSGERNLNTP